MVSGGAGGWHKKTVESIRYLFIANFDIIYLRAFETSVGENKFNAAIITIFNKFCFDGSIAAIGLSNYFNWYHYSHQSEKERNNEESRCFFEKTEHNFGPVNLIIYENLYNFIFD